MKYILLAFLVFIAACSAAVQETGDDAQVIQHVGPAEFREAITPEQVFVVDTHIPEQEHIEGTDAFIPYNEIEQRSDELPANKDTPIAVYCRSGSMSADASQTLKAMGYTNVYNLVGGANAWRSAGFAFQ